MPASSRKYLIIAPCRDEAQYLRRSLDTLLAQTVLPTLIVIVDDGSEDDTPKILAEYAAKHPALIQVVTRENRGRRSVGPGVVEAFYAGYSAVKNRIDPGGPGEFEYLCKLDLDLELPPRYFETLLQKMESIPRLGTCSGKSYYYKHGLDPDSKRVSEKLGDETSAGMTKFYRVACFKQIGGFVRQVMWDGIDCHRCRMLGWLAQSWDEPDLRFMHLRPIGSSQQGVITGRMRHGYGQWFMGTGFFYMTATSVYRMFHKPLLKGGAAMWWGYVKSMFAREDRLDDPEFRSFLRSWQRLALVVGKRRATEAVNERQANEWNLNRAPLPMPLRD